MYGALNALCPWETSQGHMYKRVCPIHLSNSPSLRNLCFSKYRSVLTKVSSEWGTVKTGWPMFFGQPIPKLSASDETILIPADFMTVQWTFSHFCAHLSRVNPSDVFLLSFYIWSLNFRFVISCCELRIRLIVFKVEPYVVVIGVDWSFFNPEIIEFHTTIKSGLLCKPGLVLLFTCCTWHSVI